MSDSRSSADRGESTSRRRRWVAVVVVDVLKVDVENAAKPAVRFALQQYCAVLDHAPGRSR